MQHQIIFENGIAMRSIDEYGDPLGEANIATRSKFGYVLDTDLDSRIVVNNAAIVMLIVPFAT